MVKLPTKTTKRNFPILICPYKKSKMLKKTQIWINLARLKNMIKQRPTGHKKQNSRAIFRDTRPIFHKFFKMMLIWRPLIGVVISIKSHHTSFSIYSLVMHRSNHQFHLLSSKKFKKMILKKRSKFYLMNLKIIKIYFWLRKCLRELKPKSCTPTTSPKILASQF